jgi:hypothetical protein
MNDILFKIWNDILQMLFELRDDLGVGRLPEANIFPFWLFSPLYDIFVCLQDFVVRHGLYLRERFHLPNKKLSITYMFKRW